MIEAVIFDCFGVLTTDHWLEFLDSLPPGPNKNAARELNRAFNAGIISDKEYYSGVAEITGREPKVLYHTEGEVLKNERLLDYIRDLRQWGFRIGLLSNVANDWVTKEFLTTDEQALFDEMIMSYQVGLVKPDPRMFMLACERLRVGPHEAVLIDDVERYCNAARDEGLQAIHYQGLDSLKAELEPLLTNPNH